MNETFQCSTRLCECGIENFEFIVSELTFAEILYSESKVRTVY